MGPLTLLAPCSYGILHWIFLLEQVLEDGWAHFILSLDNNNAGP